MDWPPPLLDVKPLDYFYWDFAKTKVSEGRSGKPFVSEAELKKKDKICLEYLYECTGTNKESNQTICPTNESCKRKKGRCIKMLFGECFYIRMAVSMCFLVFVKNLWDIADHLKDNFIQQIYRIFFF